MRALYFNPKEANNKFSLGLICLLPLIIPIAIICKISLSNIFIFNYLRESLGLSAQADNPLLLHVRGSVICIYYVSINIGSYSLRSQGLRSDGIQHSHWVLHRHLILCTSGKQPDYS